MKFGVFLFFCVFLLASFTGAVVAAEVYTRESPQVVECLTCVSNSQFEDSALNAVPENTGRHVMVYNTSTLQLNSYFVLKLNVPTLGYFNRDVYLLDNLPQHSSAFVQHSAEVASGQSAKSIKLDYPAELGSSPGKTPEEIQIYGAWARGQQEVNRALMWKSVNPFDRSKIQPVVITFANGWKLHMQIRPNSVGGGHIFVVLLNENNQVEAMNYGSGSAGGGGYGSGVGHGINYGYTITINVSRNSVLACTSINSGTRVCYNHYF